MKTTVAKIFISVFIALMLSGCSEASEEEYAETTLRVEKKGRIHETIVSSFNKDYYDLNELKSEFDRSVSEYNSSIGSDEIKLKEIKLNGTDVFVDLDFTMDVTLKGVEQGDKIGKVQIMGMPDRTIIVLSEHVRIRTYRDIAYVSANVDVLGKKDARVLSESDGLAYIVLE